MNAKLVTSIILVGLAAIFIFQNAAMVELKFLFLTLSTSMTLTIFLIFSLGIITGWLLRGTFSRRKSNAHTKHASVVAE
jgi:putative membrane protein